VARGPRCGVERFLVPVGLDPRCASGLGVRAGRCAWRMRLGRRSGLPSGVTAGLQAADRLDHFLMAGWADAFGAVSWRRRARRKLALPGVCAATIGVGLSRGGAHRGSWRRRRSVRAQRDAVHVPVGKGTWDAVDHGRDEAQGSPAGQAKRRGRQCSRARWRASAAGSWSCRFGVFALGDGLRDTFWCPFPEVIGAGGDAAGPPSAPVSGKLRHRESRTVRAWSGGEGAITPDHLAVRAGPGVLKGPSEVWDLGSI